MAYFEILKILGLKLELVQTEQSGTLHYKDENGTRVELYPDGSYRIELKKDISANAREAAELQGY